jgi:hypothetical protein
MSKKIGEVQKSLEDVFGGIFLRSIDFRLYQWPVLFYTGCCCVWSTGLAAQLFPRLPSIFCSSTTLLFIMPRADAGAGSGSVDTATGPCCTILHHFTV